MAKLFIASVNKERVGVWVDMLSQQYPLIFFNNIEFICSENRQIEKSDLLVLDAEFIDDNHPLSVICQYFNKVIVVGTAFTQTQQIEFIYQGAWGYSDIDVEKHLILRTIESVMNNEIWLKRQCIPQMLKGILDKQQFVVDKEKTNNELVKKITNLTQREIEVIKHLYTGKDNTYIAGKLNISLRTVKAHLSSIYRKLGVIDRFQLVVFLKDMQESKIKKAGFPENDDENN